MFKQRNLQMRIPLTVCLSLSPERTGHQTFWTLHGKPNKTIWNRIQNNTRICLERKLPMVSKTTHNFIQSYETPRKSTLSPSSSGRNFIISSKIPWLKMSLKLGQKTLSRIICHSVRHKNYKKKKHWQIMPQFSMLKQQPYNWPWT